VCVLQRQRNHGEIKVEAYFGVKGVVNDFGLPVQPARPSPTSLCGYRVSLDGSETRIIPRKYKLSVKRGIRKPNSVERQKPLRVMRSVEVFVARTGFCSGELAMEIFLHKPLPKTVCLCLVVESFASQRDVVKFKRSKIEEDVLNEFSRKSSQRGRSLSNRHFGIAEQSMTSCVSILLMPKTRRGKRNTADTEK